MLVKTYSSFQSKLNLKTFGIGSRVASRGFQPILRAEPGAIHDAFPHQLVPDQRA